MSFVLRDGIRDPIALGGRSRGVPSDLPQVVWHVFALHSGFMRENVWMDSAFVSSSTARLRLTSEADVLTAIDNGVLDESHYLDLKREAKSSSAANKETARDLASFAVDGGTLIIGIGETEGGIERSPQPLAGLAERLEQIAAMAVDPPLNVLTRAIATEADPAHGYLIVHVPASPEAPHMVDNRYLARGDKTKRYLTDPEVLRLHQRRLTATVDGLKLLDVEFVRDPFDGSSRENAHLFVLAEPLSARPDLLVDVTDTSQPQPSFDLRNAGLTNDLNTLLSKVGAAQFSSGLDEMQSFDRRSDGVAWTTYALAEGRTPRGDATSESAGELEIRDNGELRLYNSRLSATSDGNRMLFESVALGSIRRFLAVVKAAADVGGYYGNWALAAGGTGLKGCYSHAATAGWGGGAQGPALGEDVYRRSVTASYADLDRGPGALTERLIAPLLRALRTRERYGSVFADPSVAATPAS